MSCRASATLSVVLGLAMLSTPSPAEACSPEFEVDAVLPRTTDAPTNAVLVAHVLIPYPDMLDHVHLFDGLGNELDIDAGFEVQNQEVGLLRARPLVELAANAAYTWHIGEIELPFTTGDYRDDQAPTAGVAQVSGPTDVEILGCFGPVAGLGFAVDVPDADEPVSIQLRGLDGTYIGHAPSWDSPAAVEIPVDPTREEDLCYRVVIEDAGGNSVEAGEVCLGLVETGDGETGDGETGDGEIGDPADNDLTTRGCQLVAGTTNTGRGAALLGLLALLRPRRRTGTAR